MVFFCSLTLTFDEATSGVACNLESPGFHMLCKATEEEVGHVKPYSITGSLPLIRELQVGYMIHLFYSFLFFHLIAFPYVHFS